MKILLVNRWRHLETVGGAESVFFSMANEFSKSHCVSALAMTEDGDNPFFPLSPNVNFIHVTHCYQKQQSRVHKVARLLQGTKLRRHRYDQKFEDPIWANMMASTIERVQPEIIIAYSLELARMILCYIKPDCPVIIMFHRSAETVLDCLTEESRWTLENAACVQVLMPHDVKVVKAHVACRKLIQIPNAVISSGFKSHLNNKVIAHVARFSKNQKRQHILIEAFHLLHAEFPDWHLELWGEGDLAKDSYVQYCWNLVKKYHLENQIHFCGFTHEVPRILSNASIFAFPSAEEGMGITLVEALDVGLPAIGYRSCTAVSEIIKDGVNGYLCDDGIKPFAAALRKLMADETLRTQIGKNAKESILAFSPQRVWNEWLILLNHLVKK